MIPLATLLPIGVQSAIAAEIPKSTGADARIGELAYDRNDIFEVRVRMGIATHIVLGEGERIVASAPGIPADCRDGADWCIVAKSGSNELFVQPRTMAAQRNNLQLTTSLRRYSFDFVQSAAQAGPGPWYRVTFRYTPDLMPASAAPSCNWNYTMAAAPSGAAFVPLAIFDDGHRTYLVLPAASSRPQVAVDGRGLRVLASGPGPDVMVLDGIADAFELRAGGARLSVWNDGLRPGAPRGACPMW